MWLLGGLKPFLALGLLEGGAGLKGRPEEAGRAEVMEGIQDAAGGFGNRMPQLPPLRPDAAFGPMEMRSGSKPWDPHSRRCSPSEKGGKLAGGMFTQHA